MSADVDAKPAGRLPGWVTGSSRARSVAIGVIAFAVGFPLLGFALAERRFVTELGRVRFEHLGPRTLLRGGHLEPRAPLFLLCPLAPCALQRVARVGAPIRRLRGCDLDAGQLADELVEPVRRGDGLGAEAHGAPLGVG